MIRNDLPHDPEAPRSPANETQGDSAYHAPDLLLVGSAAKLLQGIMFDATYRDVTNSGYTYFG